MSTYIIAYLACALIFFPVDYVWLSTMGPRFYQREIGSLLREQPNLGVAALFYLAYLGGVLLFAVHPADSPLQAAMLGAALGFIAYGTYDLTNLSTVRGFTVRVAVVDMAWGMALTAVTAAGGYWISHSVFG